MGPHLAGSSPGGHLPAGLGGLSSYTRWQLRHTFPLPQRHPVQDKGDYQHATHSLRLPQSQGGVFRCQDKVVGIVNPAEPPRGPAWVFQQPRTCPALSGM